MRPKIWKSRYVIKGLSTLLRLLQGSAVRQSDLPADACLANDRF